MDYNNREFLWAKNKGGITRKGENCEMWSELSRLCVDEMKEKSSDNRRQYSSRHTRRLVD